MTASNSVYIEKKDILKLLDRADEIIPYYERENRRNPAGKFDYGSRDEVALRLLESDYGVFVTGIKLRGDDIVLSSREGHLLSNEAPEYVGLNSFNIRLPVFKDSTTISRFADSVQAVLKRRAGKGSDLACLMMAGVEEFASRTKSKLQPQLR